MIALPHPHNTMFQNFWAFTDLFVSFTQKEKEKIKDHLILRNVPKQFTLVDLGDIAREVYFINKGCLRFYYITDEGNEVTGFIFQESMFAGSHESFLRSNPAFK